MNIATTLGALTMSSVAQHNDSEWVNLLDSDLTKWEVWTGEADPSIMEEAEKLAGKKLTVEGKVIPMGLGDPFGIYKVIPDEKGEPILHINGKIYAGLTTLETYSNYHLTMQVKWGEKKWAPRLEKLRDSGILYHCHGKHGAFWGVWKRSLELQVQETDIGDLFQLGGVKSSVARSVEGVWDPSEKRRLAKQRVIRSVDMERPHGEWTRIDLYVIGDKAIHVVEGTVVMALSDAIDREGNPLTTGQIQIQAEGADCFYKDIRIREIKEFPEEVLKASGL